MSDTRYIRRDFLAGGNLTRAIFRKAEFGFLGVVVETRVQTPRLCGAPESAGVVILLFLLLLPFLTSWLIVGIYSLSPKVPC